jgi:hypothetical protein
MSVIPLGIASAEQLDWGTNISNANDLHFITALPSIPADGNTMSQHSNSTSRSRNGAENTEEMLAWISRRQSIIHSCAAPELQGHFVSISKRD